MGRGGRSNSVDTYKNNGRCKVEKKIQKDEEMV